MIKESRYYIRVGFYVPVFGEWVGEPDETGMREVVAYSVGCPHGENGPEIADDPNVIPITADDFERARAAGWELPEDEIRRMIGGRELPGVNPCWGVFHCGENGELIKSS